jgi:hypothetical protein
MANLAVQVAVVVGRGNLPSAQVLLDKAILEQVRLADIEGVVAVVLEQQAVAHLILLVV